MAQGNLRDIPGGVKGVKETLKVMSKFADGKIKIRGKLIGKTNPEIRHLAGSIVRDNCKAHDYSCAGASLLAWVQENVMWQPDTVDQETVQTAERTLAWGFGDCDDLTTLLVAMLLSIGIPSAFRVVACEPERPGQYTHVYAIVEIDGNWYAADPSVNQPFGWETNGITKAMHWDPIANRSFKI